MEYLVRQRKPRVAHLWTGKDTVCRMATTGGLKPSLYAVVKNCEPLPLCRICRDLDLKATTNTGSRS